MEKELEQFRQEVERLRAGRQKGSLPYPETLRAFAVRYVEHALEAGGTFEAAATALGVSKPTLQAWRKGKPAAHRRAKAGARGVGWCRWWCPSQGSRDGRRWRNQPWGRQGP